MATPLPKRKIFRNKRRKKKKPKPEIIPLSLPKKGIKEPRTKGRLDYKNLVLLQQYLTLQGKILPRRVTRLTVKQQKKVATTVKTARVLGLLPFIRH